MIGCFIRLCCTVRDVAVSPCVSARKEEWDGPVGRGGVGVGGGWC